jgi:hypothetical protein
MKRFYYLLFAAIPFLTTGCGTLARGINENITSRAGSFAESNVKANIQAIVLQDESDTSFLMRSMSVSAGTGQAEVGYRKVPLFIANPAGGHILGLKGGYRFNAFVPDGMPMLITGDLVEVRFTAMYDYGKDFVKTGDGTAILRILCPGTVSRSEFDTFKVCASALAWHEEWGEGNRYYDGVVASASGRPYAASLKDYDDLSYTPFWSEKGDPLPSSVAPGPRPSIKGWPSPKRY